jgi:pimeloyl-ACP methyl ester carboxylesterase
MSSYLSQFNYQFIRPSGIPASPDDFKRSDLRRFVFLHGLMGYGLNWRSIAAGLGPQDISLIFDQRGHGKSWKPLTGYAPEDFADDLEMIVQEIGWDRFYLVGHSMGGRNALAFASKFGERLIKLVIEDIGPESAPAAVEYYRRLLDFVPTPFPNKLAAKEFFMNDFQRSLFAQKNPVTLGQYLYSNIIENEDGTADWRFSKDAILAAVIQGRAKDQWDELRAVSMPTLIIRGENSTELPQDVYERMLVSNPRIQGKVIPNAGHWVHSDQPQAFLKALLEFVGA